jgi:xanthine dehydrogenase accessory factor
MCGIVMEDTVVVVRGGGDIGTGVAHRLHRSGFTVLVLEIESPLVVRRTVAFAQAVFDGEAVVEDVKAVRVKDTKEIRAAWRERNVPVMVDPACDILREIEADVVVDATLVKKGTGLHKEMAPITIALGPGFEAGRDAHVVIETKRGHDLGRLIFEGRAEPDTGVPEEVQGYGEERVLRAPCDGEIRGASNVGDHVTRGNVVGYVGKATVKAPIDGVLRGFIMDGMQVTKRLKIGDIDPRGQREYCYTISDKARAVGGGVLEATLFMAERMRSEGRIFKKP